MSLKNSTLSEWNRLFDEQLNGLQIPERRGKSATITADLVRQVIEIARDEVQSKRIRLKAFTRKLKEHGVLLSRQTVSDILTANDLYQVKVKKRRPQFYQSLRQSIPNGLLSVDGKQFKVVDGDQTHTFNLELAVDVQSFAHSAFSVSDTETTAEFIKVVEAHCSQWGQPLGVVADHGSANVSEEARNYLRSKDIEILPAGPANPKGNGSVESAFSGMEKVIGTIHLDSSSPRALARSVLEKVVSTYVVMRNRQATHRTGLPPEEAIKSRTTPEQRTACKDHYQQRAKKRKKPMSSEKQDRLQWVLDHYEIVADQNSVDRARKCIEHYDLDAITKTEEAFLRAVSRDHDRCNLAYYFGILKKIQAEMDTERHQEYCRQRYLYQQMVERERQQDQVDQDRASISVMVETLSAAMACPIDFARETAIKQAKRMFQEIKKQFKQTAPMKKRVLETLRDVKDLTIGQRNQIEELVDQLLTSN